jgi:mannose-1-phosphate guanylyltransferase
MSSERLPIHAVILAGGRGTRFWPRSRTKTPKQLLSIFGKSTMLEQTVSRLRPLIPVDRLWSVTNSAQSSALKKQLPAAARKHVLVEPIGRNTAAAIALAALHIRHAAKGDALIAVLPADHFIAHAEKYRRIVSAALDVARTPGRIVVLGIPPTHPETGYGYIEHTSAFVESRSQHAYAVRRFTEKPALELAREYVASGNYHWNAGMFFWRVSTFLENLQRHLPATHAALEKLSCCIGTRQYEKKIRATYPKLENISVDYAILERATQKTSSTQVFVIPADIGWSDIGSWSAVYDLNAKSGAADPSFGNIFLSPGFALESQGNLISCPAKFTALIGLNDLIAVETPDALLICPRSRSQDVSKLVKWLEEKKRKRLL